MESQLNKILREDREAAAARELEAQKADLVERQRRSAEFQKRYTEKVARWTLPVRISAICPSCGAECILYADGLERRNELGLTLAFDTGAGNLVHWTCGTCGARNTAVLGETLHGSPSDFPGVQALLRSAQRKIDSNR